MKKTLFICFILIPFSSHVILNAQELSIINLKCDYQYSPIGIDNMSPCLSWEYYSPDKDHVMQESYQILVASSEDLLNEKDADVWNSGVIESGNSAQVIYDGDVLQSRTKYFWIVRCWTNQSKKPLFSKSANWEMGLLASQDWKANWISAPHVYSFQQAAADRHRLDQASCIQQTEPSPYLRANFLVEKKIKKARLYISGLGYYETYLNGNKVGDHVLDPAWTSYHKKVLYVTYDVTHQLQNGNNAWGIILGDGWYNQHSRDVWSVDKAPWRDRPKVLAQLELEYEDGTRQAILTDSNWKAHESPIFFSSVRQGESYDARKEIEDWSTPGFDDNDWSDVWEAMSPLGKMEAQTLQPIRVQENFKPFKITHPKEGVYVLHYPQDLAGWVKIRVKEQAGQKITLKYGEALNEDGTLNQDKLSSYTFHDRFQTDEYFCKSDLWEEWNPRFTYHGFTYVEVTGLTVKPLPENFIAQSVYTDMDNYSSFSCSDNVINQIHRMTIWSIKGNAHGYAEASPHREKLGWTGDAHLAAEATMYNFDSKQFYRKWIDDLGIEQLESGELPAIAPTPGWGFFWGNGPAWDNAFILIPWYQYLYSGDKYILKSHYDQMQLYFEYVDKKSEDNIADFGLGDWSPPDTEKSGLYNTPAALTSTAYFYIDAVLLSKISIILGFEEQSKWYLDKANFIKEAFNKKFYEEETSFYTSQTQTAQACALYQGLTSNDNHTITVEKLVQLVNAKGNHLNTGILGSKYILYALADNGYEELAYEVITQKTFPGWGNFVEKGATTLWERWSGEGIGGNCRNLTFLADVDAWFYKYILGIKCLESYPGFKQFEISPFFFEKLDWAKGSVATMYGDIEVYWQKTKGKVILNMTIPANTSANLKLPGGYTIEKIKKTQTELNSGNHSLTLKKVE